MHLDTPIPISVCLLWTALAAVSAATVYWRLRVVAHRRVVAAMAALRLLSVLLVLLFLLNPYTLEPRPNTEAFRVVLLGDASGSMRAADADGGRTRIDVLAGLLDTTNAHAFLPRLRDRFRVDPMLFSSGTRTLPPAGPEILPGPTALGDVLNATLTQESRVPLGAIVVLSDGHGNAGLAVAEAAKACKRRGIPVSCIGIGALAPPGEVKLHTPATRLNGEKGKELILPATVSNSLEKEATVQVTLSKDGAVLATRQLVVPAESQTEVRFRTTPYSAGFHSYRLALTAEPGTPLADPSIDFIGGDIAEPAVFRILYLGAHLNWDYKFLRLAVAGSDQLNLTTVIRSGAKTFFQSGQPRLPLPADRFPDTLELLGQFDALVVDSRAIGELSDSAPQALTGFVGDRGGGLLCLGPTEHLDAATIGLLPVAGTEEHIAGTRQHVQIAAADLFPEQRTASLRCPPGPGIPARSPLFMPAPLKLSARAAATVATPRGEAPLLSVQQYGSGRVAYLGMEHSWRWHLAAQPDRERHHLFWQHLLVWLGSTGKERIAVSFAGTKAALDEPLPLSVRLLGSDFRPAPDADVSITVTPPEGPSQTFPLPPSIDESGLYSAPWIPHATGEVQARIQATLPDGTVATRDTAFLAVRAGREAEDTRFREETLRDLARITGGRYVHVSQLGNSTAFPVSDQVPTQIARRHLASSWLILLATLGALAGEWFLRRRIGLK